MRAVTSFKVSKEESVGMRKKLFTEEGNKALK